MDDQIAGLYAQYKSGLYRFALSILKNPAAAEDVLQETFVRVLSAGELPWQPGKAQAWLYRVARNLCYDHLRQSKHALPETEGIDQSNFAYLELIAPLSQAEQEIVSLKILGGLTHGEIAQVMKCSTHAAKKRYERAIAKLRAQMKEE